MAFFIETQIILNLLKEQMHNGAILKKPPEAIRGQRKV